MRYIEPRRSLRPSPADLLDTVLHRIAQNRADISGLWRRARKLVAEHPELKQRLPTSLIKPKLVVDNSSPKQISPETKKPSVERYRPNQRQDEGGPEAG